MNKEMRAFLNTAKCVETTKEETEYTSWKKEGSDFIRGQKQDEVNLIFSYPFSNNGAS